MFLKRQIIMKKLWYKKKSRLHGFGLFASCDIKKGEKVIEYIGDKVSKKEMPILGNYIFC